MSWFYLKSVYDNRSLIWLLAVTDLRLRYRNSVLGFFWSILEPLLMLTVLYVVFSFILRSNIQNYPLFLLTGLIVWNAFSRGTVMSSNCILARGGIVLNAFFPRIVLPISAVITSFLMMFFEMLVYIAFVIIFHFQSPPVAILVPFSLIPLFLLTLGISLPLSTLNVIYRDISYIWNVIVQAGFFLTPIIYTIDIFPKNIQSIIMLNPMAHVINWVHDFTLFNKIPTFGSIIFTFGVSIIVFVIGYTVFRRLEDTMVDKL
ncbi:MAG: ABC transporter permease [Thaumarchaeota archaeon]|nr:ABC transporter permease [Nitrososphaerota archaeon]